MVLTDLIEKMLLTKYEESINENKSFQIDSDAIKNIIISNLEIVYPHFFSGKSFDLNNSKFNDLYVLALSNVKFKIKTHKKQRVN